MVSVDPSNDILDSLDNAETSRFHLKTIFIAGMGFFSDAYDLFILGTAIPILLVAFGITSSSNMFGSAYITFLGAKLSSVSVEVGIIGSSALFGAFIGATVLGNISDRIGRKSVYGIEMMIIIAFAIISAFSVNVYMLIISRFFLGVGIGGDYPLSSTLMSENSNKKHRGRMVSMVFAMQGFGLLTGALIGIGAVAFLPLDSAWRFMLGFGAVPAMTVVYLRRKIKETPRYTLHVKGDAKGAAEVVSSVTGSKFNGIEISNRAKTDFRRLLRKYWLVILGTAGSWFLFDMAFYGTSVNNGYVLSMIGYGQVVGNLKATIFNIAIGNALLASVFAVPGYWIAVGIIDKVGRKTLQWIGFAVMSLVYLIMALEYTSLTHSLGLFVALYGISFLFANIGPNTTTFILPTELFPTQIRTTGHGIAAGSAKAGAGIFTFLFPVFLSLFQLTGVLSMLFVISGIAVLLTLVTITETKNRSLEDTSKQDGIEDSYKEIAANVQISKN